MLRLLLSGGAQVSRTVALSRQGTISTLHLPSRRTCPHVLQVDHSGMVTSTPQYQVTQDPSNSRLHSTSEPLQQGQAPGWLGCLLPVNSPIPRKQDRKDRCIFLLLMLIPSFTRIMVFRRPSPRSTHISPQLSQQHLFTLDGRVLTSNSRHQQEQSQPLHGIR